MKSDDFSTTSGRIYFRIILRQSENFSVFCKVSSLIAFRNMIATLLKSQSRHLARARVRAPSPTQARTRQNFTKPFLFSQLLAQNLGKIWY